jgi:transcriptional regulator with GAF, ATPase, and Fis domain
MDMAPAEQIVAGRKPCIVLDTNNLAAAERTLVDAALVHAGSIAEAAELLGITRVHLKRLIIRHAIAWPRARSEEN